MSWDEPFHILGLTAEASLAEIRSARRVLAFELHPDRGGDEQQMKALNAAFDAAVGHVTGRKLLFISTEVEPNLGPNLGPNYESPDEPTMRPRADRTNGRIAPRGRLQRDSPSFVINALPAQAFEALLIVTSWIGEVLVDDPPYQLDVHLYEPQQCWCRLRLVPDAGSSTVSLMVASVDDHPAPDVDEIRNVFVHQLNQPGAFA